MLKKFDVIEKKIIAFIAIKIKWITWLNLASKISCKKIIRINNYIHW